jgi:excisionase family DNA binding protein
MASSTSPPPPAERLYSVTELADYLRVSRWTVYRLVEGGGLRAVKVGERLRFRPADVEAYLERGRPHDPKEEA